MATTRKMKYLRRTQAVGYEDRPGRRRIGIWFDPETFEEIRRRAQAANMNLSDQVRLYVEWALEEFE